MSADLFDPDTSDLVPAADSGIQTEPAEPTSPAEMYSAKGMAYLNHRFKKQFEALGVGFQDEDVEYVVTGGAQ